DGLESSTVATWLHAAGYRTALFGKYLNGYPHDAPSDTYIPPGWSSWFSANGGNPTHQYNYDMNDNGATVHYGDAPSDHGSHVRANKVPRLVHESADTYPTNPFSLYAPPHPPHPPATPPLRYADKFPNARAPRTPSFNELDVSDKPAWVRNKPLLTDQQIAD